MREEKGKEDGADEYAEDNDQGGLGGNLEVEELVANHLDTNEAEQHAEAVAQKPEHVGDVAQQEEEGTESHDGEDVGEEDDEGVGGDGEDGGDAVDGEDDVAELDDQQHEEEGGHECTAVFADEEVVAVHLARDGEETAGELDGGMVGGVDFLLAFLDEHLDAAIDEDDAEDGQHPRDFADDGAEEEDEEEPQHDGAEDAPEEDAVVVLLVDAEADEDHDHHEDVVDGEGLLEEVAGEVLVEDLLAVGFEGLGVLHGGLDKVLQARLLGVGQEVVHAADAVDPLGMETQEDAEEHGEGDPDAGPDGGLLDFDFVVFLVEHAEVEGQHEDDEDHEGDEEEDA